VVFLFGIEIRHNAEGKLEMFEVDARVYYALANLGEPALLIREAPASNADCILRCII
jgi:hypothetical protein